MEANKNLLKRTNREFLSYIDKSTKHIYMISEFIDNSVQSAIDNNIKQVIVKIKIDIQNDCIYVIDNAAGIPYCDKDKAITNGNEVTGDTLNMFGVGMKMASIWFGRKMTIFTKNINDGFSYKMILDVDELKDDNFFYLDKEDEMYNSGISFDYDSGTIIKIEKLHKEEKYKNRYEKSSFSDSSKDEAKWLSSKLACRYMRFLEDKSLKIVLSYIDKTGTEQITKNKTPLEINNEKIPNIYMGSYKAKGTKPARDDYSGVCDFDKKLNKVVKNKLDCLISELEINLDEFINIGNIKYRDIFEKIWNLEPLVWETKINLGSNYKNLVVPYKFGFLAQNYLMWNGLSVYQHNRAIVSGPNSKENKLTWLAFEKAFSTKSYKLNNRYRGEIDLDDKIFHVDNNKIEFTGKTKDNIEEIITDYMTNETYKLNILFAEIFTIVETKQEKDKKIKKRFNETQEISNQINSSNLIDGYKLEGTTIKSCENDEMNEIQMNGFSISNENGDNFNVVYKIDDGNKNNKITFTPDYRLMTNVPTFILNVNPNFCVFRKKINEADLEYFINPLITIITSWLAKLHSNEERKQKFNTFVGRWSL